MLRALLPAAAIAAMTFTANAYEGPHPGDLALADDVCHEVCDSLLQANDDNRKACHGLCDDVATCRANYSQTASLINDCVNNANRVYALRLQGHDLETATSMAEGDKPVVTDAENFRVNFEEDGKKGYRDAI